MSNKAGQRRKPGPTDYAVVTFKRNSTSVEYLITGDMIRVVRALLAHKSLTYLELSKRAKITYTGASGIARTLCRNGAVKTVKTPGHRELDVVLAPYLKMRLIKQIRQEGMK